MGSACLFFHIRPESAILGDINDQLVECFLEVRNNPIEVSKILDFLPESKDDYYAIRAVDPAELEPHHRAARFIYLNRHCFNGLYRTNRAGKFNVPYSGSRKGPVPTEAQLIEASNSLNDTQILRLDFDHLVRQHASKGDFVYLDPPYAIRNASLDMQYGPDNFGVEDLARLQRLLEYLDKIGANFLVSYSECAEAHEYLCKWPYRSIPVLRTIAARPTDRRVVRELLISNVSGWA